MAQAKSTRPEVPEGKTRHLITRQMKANKQGFVGYETIWDEMQKVSEYQTPKKP